LLTRRSSRGLEPNTISLDTIFSKHSHSWQDEANSSRYTRPSVKRQRSRGFWLIRPIEVSERESNHLSIAVCGVASAFHVELFNNPSRAAIILTQPCRLPSRLIGGFPALLKQSILLVGKAHRLDLVSSDKTYKRYGHTWKRRRIYY
jgi:hypothetical protein